MRVTRIKKTKRLLQFYKKTFAFREPYQVVVDGEFAQCLIRYKIMLKIQLGKLLGGAQVKLMTTPCILHELKSKGDEYFGAYIASKRYESIHNCKHQPPIAPAECLLELLQDTNKHHYMIAAQDEALLRRIRELAGIPSFHIHRGVLIMDDLSSASKEKQTEVRVFSSLLFDRTGIIFWLYTLTHSPIHLLCFD